MNTILRGGAVAALLVLGAAQAEGFPVTNWKFKQGALEQVIAPACVGPVCISVAEITIGDYMVESVSSVLMNGTAGPAGSNLQVTALGVRRITSGSAEPLELWVSGVGYTLPDGPGYILDVTHAATKSGTGMSGAVSVDAEAFLHFGLEPFNTSNSSGLLTCSLTRDLLQSCRGKTKSEVFPTIGNVDFTLTIRLVFNVEQSDLPSVIGTTAQTLLVSEQ